MKNQKIIRKLELDINYLNDIVNKLQEENYHLKQCLNNNHSSKRSQDSPPNVQYAVT